jgi:DNA-binding NarL/FixJ family response regulator
MPTVLLGVTSTAIADRINAYAARLGIAPVLAARVARSEPFGAPGEDVDVVIIDADALGDNVRTALRNIAFQLPMARILVCNSEGDRDVGDPDLLGRAKAWNYEIVAALAHLVLIFCALEGGHQDRSALGTLLPVLTRRSPPSWDNKSSARPPSIPAQRRLATEVGAVRLTDREVQVVGLIAEGRSNTQIARDLRLSNETVKTHVRRILRKLQADDRAHAVANAFRANLLT